MANFQMPPTKAPAVKKVKSGGDMALPAKQTFSVSISAQGPKGEGTYQARMNGAQLGKALAGAMHGGAMRTKEHGDLKPTKVTITNPQTGQTMTTTFEQPTPQTPDSGATPGAPQ
jgi:hypothetical protein